MPTLSLSRRRRSHIHWTIVRELCSRVCAACGSGRDITIDHIIPLSKGGSDDPDNLQPLCSRCNFMKGNRLTDDDLRKILYMESHGLIKYGGGRVKNALRDFDILAAANKEIATR